jgi:hypothetical protein
MKRDGQFNWVGWQSLGGKITSSPSCVSWGNSRIDCFARAGSDNALWTITYQALDSGKWSGWSSLGGQIIGPPSATAWGPGNLTIFARGTDHALFQLAFYANGPVTSIGGAPGWQGWRSDGGFAMTDAGCGALLADDRAPDSAGIGRRVACYVVSSPQQISEYASWAVGSGEDPTDWHLIPIEKSFLGSSSGCGPNGVSAFTRLLYCNCTRRIRDRAGQYPVAFTLAWPELPERRLGPMGARRRLEVSVRPMLCSHRTHPGRANILLRSSAVVDRAMGRNHVVPLIENRERLSREKSFILSSAS